MGEEKRRSQGGMKRRWMGPRLLTRSRMWAAHTKPLNLHSGTVTRNKWNWYSSYSLFKSIYQKSYHFNISLVWNMLTFYTILAPGLQNAMPIFHVQLRFECSVATCSQWRQYWTAQEWTKEDIQQHETWGVKAVLVIISMSWWPKDKGQGRGWGMRHLHVWRVGSWSSDRQKGLGSVL